MHVQIALFDGFDPLDVIAPYEVFHTAGVLTGGGTTVELVSVEGPRRVPSGLPLIGLDATAAPDAERADVIVVPGAAGTIELDPQVDGGIGQILTRAATSALPQILADALAREDTTVATVCGGSLVVAYAGLADGRPLVTHGNGTELEGTKAIPVGARVVDDGNLVSAGLVTSGLDMALHLVERELGPQIAYGIELAMRHERRGTVWRPTGPSVVAS
jgi:putative intracellular protease/amidase